MDDTVMVGRMALPKGTDPRPAVLIAHEGAGLNDHQLHRAERLAELGYVAFALDYYGGGQWIADREEMFARLNVLLADPDRMRALGRAGLGVLLDEPRTDPSRVAAIGYCAGGTMALELARAGEDIKAVVGFHPSLTTKRPEDAARIVGKVLVCVGSEDPFITQEHRLLFEEEMRAAGVDWRLNLYGGAQHSFTHPPITPDGRVSEDPAAEAERAVTPGIAYDRASDERSWRAMLDLFDETFN
ncbi:dienelactone hydrolase family protein [Streptomyces abikoensis]|uniref:dienelactone hydrolase family protein n=1 Tax=Streptomyces abikoensis TaxID=97398 RepID=UPI0034028125